MAGQISGLRAGGVLGSFAVSGGTITATVTDGQACFNLNSLVLGFGEDLTARPLGAAQFRARRIPPPLFVRYSTEYSTH